MFKLKLLNSKYILTRVQINPKHDKVKLHKLFVKRVK